MNLIPAHGTRAHRGETRAHLGYPRRVGHARIRRDSVGRDTLADFRRCRSRTARPPVSKAHQPPLPSTGRGHVIRSRLRSRTRERVRGWTNTDHVLAMCVRVWGDLRRAPIESSTDRPRPVTARERRLMRQWPRGDSHAQPPGTDDARLKWDTREPRRHVVTSVELSALQATERTGAPADARPEDRVRAWLRCATPNLYLSLLQTLSTALGAAAYMSSSFALKGWT